MADGWWPMADGRLAEGRRLPNPDRHLNWRCSPAGSSRSKPLPPCARVSDCTLIAPHLIGRVRRPNGAGARPPRV